jgi:hypothetical protein
MAEVLNRCAHWEEEAGIIKAVLYLAEMRVPMETSPVIPETSKDGKGTLYRAKVIPEASKHANVKKVAAASAERGIIMVAQ